VNSVVNPFRLKLSESLASPWLFTLSLEGCVIFSLFFFLRSATLSMKANIDSTADGGEINE
jgi:hypothetical protein